MQNTKSQQLEERFLEFGVNVIRFVMNHKMIPRSVADQTIRAATSIGANYAGAQNASSRADFRNNIFIAKKEAAETRYWLQVIGRLISPEAVQKYMQAEQEIIMILQKIVSALRGKTAT